MNGKILRKESIDQKQKKSRLRSAISVGNERGRLENVLELLEIPLLLNFLLQIFQNFVNAIFTNSQAPKTLQ